MYGHSSSLKNGIVLKILTSLPLRYFPYGVRPVGKRVICSGILSIWIGTFPIRRGSAPHSSIGNADAKLAKSNPFFVSNSFHLCCADLFSELFNQPFGSRTRKFNTANGKESEPVPSTSNPHIIFHSHKF
jgi:hypothetical protein